MTVKEVIGKKSESMPVMSSLSKVLKKDSTRPDHQKLIEEAHNRGDDAEVQRIIDKIPDHDPYKKSMQRLFPRVGQ